MLGLGRPGAGLRMVRSGCERDVAAAAGVTHLVAAGATAEDSKDWTVNAQADGGYRLEARILTGGAAGSYELRLRINGSTANISYTGGGTGTGLVGYSPGEHLHAVVELRASARAAGAGYLRRMGRFVVTRIVTGAPDTVYEYEGAVCWTTADGTLITSIGIGGSGAGALGGGSIVNLRRMRWAQ